MYSIIISIFFYIIGFWLMAKEAKKEPNNRSVWSYLSAILSLVMGPRGHADVANDRFLAEFICAGQKPGLVLKIMSVPSTVLMERSFYF